MKKLYTISLTIYIFTLIILLYDFHLRMIVSFIALFPVFFIKSYLYKNEYLLYIYLTQVLGSSVGLYTYPYYDKIMHFLSGLIFVIIGYILFQKHITSKKILYITINCFEMSLGFLWEVFEYAGLIFVNYDASHHYTTGVHDTMQDMIFSFVAGLIMTYLIDRYPIYIRKLYKQPQDSHKTISQQ